jgi:hypothetical protein
MTRQSSFKKKIRARMKKTGERYAAARLALLRQAGGDGKPSVTALDGYQSPSAVHGDTARLCAALGHAGVVDPATGAPFTEASVFALSGGLGFMYFLFEYKGHPPMLTFTCRSWSMPWPMVERALDHAGVHYAVTETGGAAKAQKTLDAALDEGKVAHLTLDGASLPWRGADPQWKGQAPRQVNVIGRDDGHYLVDDGRWRVLDRAALADARAATKKQKQRMVLVEGGEADAGADMRLQRAAAATVKTFTDAPVANYASAFGLNGLQKAAELTGDSKDKKRWRRVFDSPSLAALALTRTWECIHLEYTAPAASRPFYAEGLRELAGAKGVKAARRKAANRAADLADKSAEQWEAMATAARDADPAVERAIDLAESMEEFASLGDDGAAMAGLRDARAAALEASTLDEDRRVAVFNEISGHFSAIAEIEQHMVDALRDTSA